MEIGNFHNVTLLTGAGFPANWEGFLQPEIFDRLLGHPLIKSNNTLRKIVLENVNFESALVVARQEGIPENDLRTLEDAVVDVFLLHDRSIQNSAFTGTSGINIYGVQQFLSRFFGSDAGYLFTLNQDLLLERKFFNYNTWNRHVPKPSLPGVPSHPEWFGSNFGAGSSTGLPEDYIRRIPETKGADRNWPPPTANRFNYVKLHGSFEWRAVASGRLFVVGGEKADTISRSRLLSFYIDLFTEVCLAGSVRLFVTGYSFRDHHINSIIASGVREAGLQIYIHNTTSPDDLRKSIGTVASTEGIWDGLIGYSRKSLVEIFPPDQHRTSELERIESGLFDQA